MGSLDTRNPKVWNEFKDYPSTTGNPSLRLTGISFDVRIIYAGSLDPAFGAQPLHATCKITTKLGWHSVQDLAHGDSLQFGGVNSTSISTTSRGAHFRVSFGGSVGVFNLLFVVTALANISVFFVASSLVVQWTLLHFIGYKSHIIDNAANEVITVDGVHAQKAAQALIAATALSKLRQDLQDRHVATSAAGQTEHDDMGASAFADMLTEELKRAGASDEHARGIVQILRKRGMTQGQVDFNSFVDSSSYQSTVKIARVSTKALHPAANNTHHSMRSVSVPNLTKARSLLRQQSRVDPQTSACASSSASVAEEVPTVSAAEQVPTADADQVATSTAEQVVAAKAPVTAGTGDILPSFVDVELESVPGDGRASRV